MVSLLDVSLIIPTYKRELVLARTIESISNQSYQPGEIIIVDATEPFRSKSEEWKMTLSNLQSDIIYVPAITKGAAAQRNYALKLAKFEVIGFCDDDVLLEADCFKNLWDGLTANKRCGGINAIMVNQTFHPLGRVSRFFYSLVSEQKYSSYAGRCFGPAIAFYPEPGTNNPSNVKVDWLHSCLVFYKKEALPSPVFDNHFVGYSLMEDLALSLKVAKNWDLLAAQTARIYHDSQPGDDKNNLARFCEMDLVNRFFIMKYILNKTSFKDKWNLFLQQLFGGITSKVIIEKNFWTGKISGLKKLRSI